METQKLREGIFLLKNALTESDVQVLLGLYVSHKEDLYKPKLKNGYSMSLDMFCMGHHWDATDYKYKATRADYDNKPVPTSLGPLNEIAARYLSVCFPEYAPDWDICLMNYYNGTSKLGYHQDNSESKETLKSGHPVVSFSIGAGCIFRVGGLKRKDPMDTVLLEHGDVLMFGGPSRLIFHGVDSLVVQRDSLLNRDEAPLAKELNHGRLNFTLRKM